MRKLCFCIITFFLSRNISQAQYCDAGAEAMALCGAAMSVVDVWAVYNNPAALASLSTFAVGAATMSAFVPQLNRSSIAAATPIHHYVFAFSYDHFGFDLFHAHHAALAAATEFSSLLSGALKFNYFATIIDHYRPLHQAAFEMALSANISSRLLLSSHIYNLIPIKAQGESLTSFIRVSAAYKLEEDFMVIGELEQEVLQKLRIKFGGQYIVKNVLWLSGGCAINPSEITFGVGWKRSNIKYSIAADYLLRLGFSSQVSLAYTFEK